MADRLNAPVSKTLRVGAGESSSREVALSLAKPKAKKGYIDPFCHNETRVYARSGSKWLLTTICSGVRYVLEPIEPAEKYPFIRKIRKNVAGVR